MTLELLREDGAPYRVVVRAAASERRGLTFLCVAPPGAPAALSPSWQKRPVEDAAFGYAFDVYTEELAVPVALDERLRQALLRFPRPLLGPPVRFAYDAAEATLSWPVGGAPEDAAIDAALAVVAVACPVTPAARRRMN